jgi:hypothetical protein
MSREAAHRGEGDQRGHRDDGRADPSPAGTPTSLVPDPGWGRAGGSVLGEVGEPLGGFLATGPERTVPVRAVIGP